MCYSISFWLEPGFLCPTQCSDELPTLWGCIVSIPLLKLHAWQGLVQIRYFLGLCSFTLQSGSRRCFSYLSKIVTEGGNTMKSSSGLALLWEQLCML